MRKIIYIVLLLSMILSLCACGSSQKETVPVGADADSKIDSETNADESVPEAEEEDKDLKTCYVCGTKYASGGYRVTVSNGKIDMCKSCRDELLVKNGFVVIDGKKEYPFVNEELYQDDLLTIPVPDGYYLDEDSVYYDVPNVKAVFTYSTDEDITILVRWENFFEGFDEPPTIEDRTNCNTNVIADLYDCL